MKVWVAVATYYDDCEGIEPCIAVATTREGAIDALEEVIRLRVEDYPSDEETYGPDGEPDADDDEDDCPLIGRECWIECEPVEKEIVQ